MTQDIELPNDGLTPDCRDLLEGLLKRDVPDRLGCRGRGPSEVKEHPFFKDVDWQTVCCRLFSRPVPCSGLPPSDDASSDPTEGRGQCGRRV